MEDQEKKVEEKKVEEKKVEERVTLTVEVEKTTAGVIRVLSERFGDSEGAVIDTLSKAFINNMMKDGPAGMISAMTVMAEAKGGDNPLRSLLKNLVDAVDGKDDEDKHEATAEKCHDCDAFDGCPIAAASGVTAEQIAEFKAKKAESEAEKSSAATVG